MRKNRDTPFVMSAPGKNRVSQKLVIDDLRSGSNTPFVTSVIDERLTVLMRLDIIVSSTSLRHLVYSKLSGLFYLIIYKGCYSEGGDIDSS